MGGVAKKVGCDLYRFLAAPDPLPLLLIKEVKGRAPRDYFNTAFSARKGDGVHMIQEVTWHLLQVDGCVG